MLRIRRVYDDILPVNREILNQVREILKSRFPDINPEEIEQIGEKLRNPFKQRFRMVLLVAETLKGRVLGFAMLLHEPVIEFLYLDWIATASGKAGGGLGSALYDRVRREAAALNVKGLFFECLPDESKDCPAPAILRENQARLRFYEQYGARPIIRTAYETPVSPEDTCMPYLVYDGLDRERPLAREFARKVVRAVLERKYRELCPPEYVEKVVASFKENPIALREFRYVKPEAVKSAVEGRSVEQIALVMNDRHEIHHVHERGYVEAPVRVRSILSELHKSGLFVQVKPRSFPDRHLHAVHDPDFVNYIKKACREVPEGKSLYPYIFPIRNKTRPPKEPSVLSGYYCIDTFTPINRNAFPAARSGVDCALTAARQIIEGRRIAYALVRPPGHHAERRAFGGFCYFNNNAVAAQYLSGFGTVAILDLDYHHGNGQQDIFYRRSDVLTVSIHGHPAFAYPYFSGFEDERGEGDGDGFNLNMALPESVDGPRYRKGLEKALDRIKLFAPRFLVVALGLDPAKGDPTGTWSLLPKDFLENGRMIGALGLPTVVIQEGGYRIRTLGRNAISFFNGLAAAGVEAAGGMRNGFAKISGIAFRTEIQAEDPERVRRIMDVTGFFRPEELALAEARCKGGLSGTNSPEVSFLFAEIYGRLAGFAAYGPSPLTAGSYDIHWLVVHPDFQGRGAGRLLLRETERRIAAALGRRIYVDTSQRVQYASTRTFYENRGYRLEAVLDDFYAPGEGKVIYSKTLNKLKPKD